MFVNFNILNQLGSPAINSNTFANRPAAGQTGRLFVSTDTFEIYRDNGTTWDLIGGPGTSTITGSGTAGTIPLWTSSSAIGDSDLRQLSTKALILNSATNDWPTTAIANDAGRILLTSATNNPTFIAWSKCAFGSGDEQGEIWLGAQTALGTTTIGGVRIQGYIENGTDGAGSFAIDTTTALGTLANALLINSSQVSTFSGNVIIPANRLGIGNSNPGAALDIHSTGVMAQLNSTSATANTLLAFQRSGTGLWRIGDVYNGGSNYFELYNTVLGTTGLQLDGATNKAVWQSQQTYSTGLARANYFDYNLSVPAATSFTSPNAITALGASLDLTLAGNATIPSGARTGLDAYNSVSFTGAGTLTMTQGTQIRPYSNITAGWAFNGSAAGTITHLAGLRVLFPDNSGSAVTITNNYGLLINDQTANTGTVTYTNRWGIYQEGASDLNYFAANTLIGTTTNAGYKLDVNGSGRIVDNVILATNSGTNVGVGTTLANWGSGHKAIQIQNGSLHTENNDNDVSLGANLYYDSSATIKYIVNDTATLYRQDDGQHIFYRAVSGIANNNISLIPSFISTNNSNFGIGASTNPVYKLEVSADGGSERIRVGTLQNNNNTARFEAITSASVSAANSAWLRVNYGAGATIGVSSYTKTGGDSGNFSNLSSEVETSVITIASSNNVLINTTTDTGQKFQVNGNIYLTGTLSGYNAIFLNTIESQVNGSQFGTATLSGRSIIVQAGSADQAIQFKNAAGGDGTLYATGTSTTMNYRFDTYSNSNALIITNAGNLEVLNSIKTGTPTGGTAAAWKLGSRVAATVVVNTTEYIEVDIGGTLYKLATVT